jgi:hypothetical protein
VWERATHPSNLNLEEGEQEKCGVAPSFAFFNLLKTVRLVVSAAIKTTMSTSVASAVVCVSTPEIAVMGYMAVRSVNRS